MQKTPHMTLAKIGTRLGTYCDYSCGSSGNAIASAISDAANERLRSNSRLIPERKSSSTSDTLGLGRPFALRSRQYLLP